VVANESKRCDEKVFLLDVREVARLLVLGEFGSFVAMPFTALSERPYEARRNLW
jgi:hypothetical protein